MMLSHRVYIVYKTTEWYLIITLVNKISKKNLHHSNSESISQDDRAMIRLLLTPPSIKWLHFCWHKTTICGVRIAGNNTNTTLSQMKMYMLRQTKHHHHPPRPYTLIHSSYHQPSTGAVNSVYSSLYCIMLCRIFYASDNINDYKPIPH